VLSVAFSPDRQLLAAGAMDGTVAVWDVAAGGQLLHIGGLKGHHKPVRSLAFTPGGWQSAVAQHVAEISCC
jgi:WD repeat-containing protein 61